MLPEHDVCRARRTKREGLDVGTHVGAGYIDTNIHVDGTTNIDYRRTTTWYSSGHMMASSWDAFDSNAMSVVGRDGDPSVRMPASISTDQANRAMTTHLSEFT